MFGGLGPVEVGGELGAAGGLEPALAAGFGSGWSRCDSLMPLGRPAGRSGRSDGAGLSWTNGVVGVER